DSAHLLIAFRQGLSEGGFVEGHNVAIEFRWAGGEYDRLAALATDLVSRRVKVLAAVGGGPSALSAKRATSHIPTGLPTRHAPRPAFPSCWVSAANRFPLGWSIA